MTKLTDAITQKENKPRNTIWVPYLWTPGLWEKTRLRDELMRREG